MRFHVVALPHTSTTAGYNVCAYTVKIMRFCRMMYDRGHTVMLYSGEENEAICSEHVPCITEFERMVETGPRHYVEASFDFALPHWRKFNDKVIAGIKARAQPRDFLCLTAGVAHQQIANALPDMMAVEVFIGYGGSFAPYRVWESYAWMHTCYGARSNNNPSAADGMWYDAVIPSGFDPADFPYSAHKDDYFLFVGRLVDRKGFQIAADTCQALGKRLIVAGHGVPPTYGEHVGTVNEAERGRLMSRARALFAPTKYLEPFGNVAVEAQLCGTPVISTDWGAFTETVEQGVSGFRCRTLPEFIAAAEAVKRLSAIKIRNRARKLYSLDAVSTQYETYFKRLHGLYGKEFGGDWYGR